MSGDGTVTIDPDTEYPMVTMGLPVRNGEALIAGAIEAALAQTYPNFRLLVSDNCSTDRTQEICEAYAARDPRICYHRQPTDLGAIGNFEWLAHQADSPFFMWVAHDDVRASDTVSRLVVALRDNPDAIIAFGDTQEIALNGTRRMLAFDGDTQGLGLFARLKKTAQPQFLQTYGLWRTEALHKLHFGATAWGQEVPMMMAAACLGEVVQIEGAVLQYRVNPKPFWQLRASRDDVLPWRGLIARLPARLRIFAPRFAMSRLVIGTFRAVNGVAGPWAGIQASGLIIKWLARQIGVWVTGRLPKLRSGNTP